MFLLVFWACFGSHDEADLLAFKALQGLPRPARGTHGRSYCGRNRLSGRQHVAGTAAKLGCAFSHSAERIVDELGLLYLKTVKFAEKHGQRIAYSWFNSIKRFY